jgi:hypothetical protein
VNCPHCGAALPVLGDAYCPECRKPVGDPPAGRPDLPVLELDSDADPAERAIRRLQERVTDLEWRLGRSGITSDNFLRRAFTVWGHFFVAHLLIVLTIMVPLTCLSVLVAR